MDRELATQDERNRPTIVTMMTTEHYALQTERAMMTSDANGRSALFLSTVSVTLVALAFVGQISHLGAAFSLFALVLLPTLFWLGFITFERVTQITIQDVILARGINRVRHFYVELAPAMKDYFILSTHDDEQGAYGTVNLRGSLWQVFLTTPGMIAFIDGVLAGAFAGLLVAYLFAFAPPLSVATGFALFAVTLVLLLRYQARRWSAAQRSLTALFPSDDPAAH